MACNFIPCDREQSFLMPPSLRDWLPDDHLAWFVLDAVAQMDLSAFEAKYRADGWGAAAFPPSMMVPLLLYAYTTGQRSAENIEVAGVEEKVGTALADAGYWSEANVQVAEADGPELLIATTKDWRQRKAARQERYDPLEGA